MRGHCAGRGNGLAFRIERLRAVSGVSYPAACLRGVRQGPSRDTAHERTIPKIASLYRDYSLDEVRMTPLKHVQYSGWYHPRRLERREP